MMASASFLHVFLILSCFNLNLLTHSYSSAQPLCHDDERSALLQFKHSFNIKKFASSDPSAYPKVESWKLDANSTSDCCSWDGVECDHDSGRVIGLDLSSSFLYGSFNSNNTLFSLVHLQRLNLADNHFNFSQIPTGFGNLSRLKSLDLHNSFFSGQIPPEISSLSQLIFLDLSAHFDGVGTEHLLKLEKPTLRDLIPCLTKLKVLRLIGVNVSSTVPSVLSNMTSLTILELSCCLLYGEFPMGIFHLPNLQILGMTLNHDLIGYIPEFSRGSPLERLMLDGTSFSGLLPTSIGNLDSLNVLELGSSDFYGSLPASLGNLTQLMYLDLSENNFSGWIPSSIANLSKLTHLGLSGAAFNAGTLPFLLGKLPKLTGLFITRTTLNEKLPQSLANLTQLSMLVLSTNELVGEIPSWLQNLTHLTVLDLAENQFSGMFPSSISQLKHLVTIDFSFNRLQGPLPLPPPSVLTYKAAGNLLTGKIPASFCQYRSLIALDLSDNYLSGAIPECLGSTSDSLLMLNLSSNNFHGAIPHMFMSVIKMIDLSQNQLQGVVPRSLANCTMLEILVLGDNQISGTFPFWLGTLPALQILILRSNKFYGAIENPKTRLKFSKLRIIDLSHNGFSGTLPSKYFQNWIAMKVVTKEHSAYMEVSEDIIGMKNQVFIWDYTYSVTISTKGTNRLYEKIQSVFVVVDLSDNNFTGKIPESIGSLCGLQALNISKNNLIGTIPSSLANLTNLESLDISRNLLSGEIPQQLTQLTFLSVLNVSHNHLTGRIPQGKQYDTFDNSSYDGNMGLCGAPLTVSCENSETSPPPSPAHSSQGIDLEFSDGIFWMVTVIGYGSGLIVGLIIGQTLTRRYHEWFIAIFERRKKISNRPKRRGQRN